MTHIGQLSVKKHLRPTFLLKQKISTVLFKQYYSTTPFVNIMNLFYKSIFLPRKESHVYSVAKDHTTRHGR